MKWFSFTIDPLLVYLDRRLAGIPIISLPVFGPCQERKPCPVPIVERYKVYGLADDVKPSVSTMADFKLVDSAAALFERSSDNYLHRNPVTGKCKVLWEGGSVQ